jgi:hypothetical protein
LPLHIAKSAWKDVYKEDGGAVNVHEIYIRGSFGFRAYQTDKREQGQVVGDKTKVIVEVDTNI